MTARDEGYAPGRTGFKKGKKLDAILKSVDSSNGKTGKVNQEYLSQFRSNSKERTTGPVIKVNNGVTMKSIQVQNIHILE